jgi:hypothetical protein
VSLREQAANIFGGHSFLSIDTKTAESQIYKENIAFTAYDAIIFNITLKGVKHIWYQKQWMIPVWKQSILYGPTI